MKRFKEYLNSKGQLDKPTIDAKADTGPTSTNKFPEAASSGKGPDGKWKDKAAISEKPTDYANSTEFVKGNYGGKKSKDEPGFADDGDKKLVYEPETPKMWGKEGGQKLSSWPKTTEEFINATKDMSLAEFAQSLRERHKIGEAMTACFVGEAANDPHFVEMIVMECKRQGTIANLVGELLKHQETYNALGASIASEATGPSASRRLVRGIQEITDAPASDTEEGNLKGTANPPVKASANVPANPAVGTRKAKSIQGETLDMNGVVSSKAKIRPEQFLLKALGIVVEG